MNWKIKTAITLAILDLVAVNVGLGYVVWTKTTPQSAVFIPEPQNTTTVVNTDECGTACQQIIEDKLSQALDLLPTPKVVTVKTPPATSKAKTQSVAYVPVPGNGSTTSNEWVSLPGTDFYFDPHDYPGLKSVYFEVNARLFNGNGQAYVRLFDVTHGIGVVGSEVNTGSQASVALESGQVSFWQGKNLIRVQAKSLTADTAIFDSGSLKVTTEN